MNELFQQFISIKQRLTVALKKCEEIVIEEGENFNLSEWVNKLKSKLEAKNMTSDSEDSDSDFVEVSTLKKGVRFLFLRIKFIF